MARQYCPAVVTLCRTDSTYQVKHTLCLDQIVLKHCVVRPEEVQRGLQLREVDNEADKLRDGLCAYGDLVRGHSHEQRRSQGEDGALREVQAVQ